MASLSVKCSRSAKAGIIVVTFIAVTDASLTAVVM